MPTVNPRTFCLLAASCLLAATPLVNGQSPASNVNLTKLADRVRVEIDGQLFTEYVFGDGASRPYCYPIVAPDGTSLTRDYPMKKTPGDDEDHPWHRSLWFAHSSMNNVDFWNEGTGDAGKSPPNKGRSEHQSFIETKSGKMGVIATKNRWVAPDGKVLANDERTLTFHAGPAGRYIDFDITLHAVPDAPLLMGDNKDGTMAVRVAQWMSMPHTMNVKDADGKTVRKEVGGKGHIVTSAGERDGKAWSTRAPWCDYNAEHNGKTYGIAIFDHPQNLRHPTWWHVRDYGLFGANPFGKYDFEKARDTTVAPKAGEYTIPAGGTLRLRYRLYFHLGDEKAAQLDARYAEYAAGK
jgi:hypothetical protein